MSNSIVLFATKYGSTQEIAEKLALLLEIPCKNVNRIQNISELDRYDTLILGAPIYGNDIMKDMKHFLHDHFIDINIKKLITFVVDGIMKDDSAIDNKPVMSNHLSTKPLLMLRFIGRLTRTALDTNDYQWMERFYRERLGNELNDFDYFEPKTIEEATERIMAVMESDRNT